MDDVSQTAVDKWERWETWQPSREVLEGAAIGSASDAVQLMKAGNWDAARRALQYSEALIVQALEKK
jgi:hypothetical protein